MKLTKKRLAMGIMAFALLLPGLAVAVSPFVDVIPGAFYEDSVNWAFSNGITTGTDATHFNPDGAVTRGQSVTFLKRYDDNIVQPAITGLGNTVGNSLGQLTCGAGQVAKSDGTNWACGNDIDTTIADTTIPNTDTLAGLGCATNQVARYDGTNWVCNTITAHYRVAPGTTTKVDSAISSSAYTSIAVGTDGFPVVSYYDNTLRDLKVVHCANETCSSKDTPVTLDSIGDVGRYTSITIGSDNFPIISYLDATNADLKAVHCTVATCATYDTPVVIDATAASGMNFTALAIGAGGLPVIAYRGTSNNVLRAVECTDPGCLDHYRIITLDSTTNNNYEGSIATTNSGRPIVSYRGGSTDVLVSAIELVMTGISFG